ncbi:transglutaminase domain-containing protein [Methanocalculus taiwanensis]|nr:transglutaminase domain-containing protein [Methanocalculus taiwanensis]
MSKKNSKNRKDWLTTAFLLILFFSLLYTIHYIHFNQSTEQLDSYFSIQYDNQIHPIGEREISFILNKTDTIDNDTEKLEAIAEWVSQNFTYFLFEEKYFNPNYTTKYLDYPINRYLYDSYGKIRPEVHSFISLVFCIPSKYANNPQWIAYYKMGGCGELAVLFEDVANKSGYNTRPIRATLTENNHAWVEVEVDAQWYFFDPTNYYIYHIMKVEGYNNTWFGKPEQYSIFSANQIRSIVDANTREKVIERYPQLKKETRIIIKSINQKKFEGISIPNSTEIIKLVNKQSS